MEDNEIITLEFSQEQQLFHFKFKGDRDAVCTSWKLLGKIELDKAIDFCDMIDKKYKNKELYFFKLVKELCQFKKLQ
jgi:hypothetical protein